MTSTLSKYLKFLLIIILLVFVSCSTQKTESKIVTGTVIDKEYRLPIEGANVIVKGSKGIERAVQTDKNGKFEIKVKEGEILVISFVGMPNKMIKITSKKRYKIKMKETGRLPFE